MGRFDDFAAGIRSLLGNGDLPPAVAIRRGTTTSPDALYDASGRSIVIDPETGWPVGTEAWAAQPRGTARVLDTLPAEAAAAVRTPAPRFDGIDAPRVASPDLSIGSPLFDDMARSADSMNPGRLRQRANVIPGGRRGDPNPAGDLKRIAAQNIDDARAAADADRRLAVQRDNAYRLGGGLALVGAGAGLTQMASPGTGPAQPKPKEPVVIQSGGEADLVNETRPAPEVPATPVKPEPTVVKAPEDYGMQARAMINKLNDMRRAAGGEVREAPAMMKEINRLLALSDKQRNQPKYTYPEADPARDPMQKAHDLIQQVNQLYRQGYRDNSPEVRRIMAQVRQLHAQGDAIRNNRKNYR